MKSDITQFDIELVKSSIARRINISVKPNGKIKVIAGQRITKKAIVNFLHKHESWLKENLAKAQKVKDKYPPKRFVQGESFLFAGKNSTLSFVKGVTKRWKFLIQCNVLTAYVPSHQWNPSFNSKPQPQVRLELLNYYKQRGIEKLTLNIKLYSDLMNLYPKKLSFRAQQTRWGSCDSAGSLSLNWKLVAAPPEVLSYVVIHELAHLRHLNHSPVFWSLVEKHCPDYKAHIQWLQTHSYELDFLSIKSKLHD